MSVERVFAERRPVAHVPLDWVDRKLLPWAMPRRLYYLTPWAWMRSYLRMGDWLCWRAWYATRPLMWGLEDGSTAWEDATVKLLRRLLGRGPE